jgi:hypothetical protein
VRKTFSASFVPQPAENNTSHTPLRDAAHARQKTHRVFKRLWEEPLILSVLILCY